MNRRKATVAAMKRSPFSQGPRYGGVKNGRPAPPKKARGFGGEESGRTGSRNYLALRGTSNGPRISSKERRRREMAENRSRGFPKGHHYAA